MSLFQCTFVMCWSKTVDFLRPRFLYQLMLCDYSVAVPCYDADKYDCSILVLFIVFVLLRFEEIESSLEFILK